MDKVQKQKKKERKKDLSKIFFKNGSELVMQCNLNINKFDAAFNLNYETYKPCSIPRDKVNKDSNHPLNILQKIPYIPSFAE